MERITAKTIKTMPGCIEIGDIVIFPPPLDLDGMGEIMEEMRQQGLVGFHQKAVFKEDPRHPFSPAALLMRLEDMFKEEWLRKGEDPSWLEELPLQLKQFLRSSWHYYGEYFEPFAILQRLPYSDTYGFAVREGGFIESICAAFKLWRLRRIHQLGFLSYPIRGGTGHRGLGFRFHHTRFAHTLEVAFLMTILMINAGADERELRIGQLAALLHDALTPAGGDSVKAIDPENLDEEKGIETLLAKTSEWPQLKKELAIQEEDVIRIIQGEGVMGALLDVADKVSYVSRDLSLIVPPDHHRDRGWRSDSFLEIVGLTTGRPGICAVWDDVRIAGKQVCFTNPYKLGDFLILRAMLFRDLYHSPHTRFFEIVAGQVVVGYLYHTGWINADVLRGIVDDQLADGLAQQGIYSVMSWLPSSLIEIEEFNTLPAAKAREQELIAEGKLFVIIEDLEKMANPATDLLVLTPREETVRPFKGVFPEQARLIESILTPAKPVRLYYLAENPPMADWLLEALSSFKKRQAEKIEPTF